MLCTAFLSLILFTSLTSSSPSLLRKTIVRRQLDPEYCHAIVGFECQCSDFRLKCATDVDLPSSITILQDEKYKYQTVELVISAQRDIYVNDRTFEPIKELFKSDEYNFEFHIKFEKFTELQLASSGLFNRVFPANLPSNARKHLQLEIYNPEVSPNDNQHLFQNLTIDSVELYTLYPWTGTFQQLFDGANIKYLHSAGGDMRSDFSQPFTGNIARLEIAKQASELSVQNFPVYPVHEFIINVFYVSDLNHEHPPNYNNLEELRVHSMNRIPANAFRDYPNIRTLKISAGSDIDPQALNGLKCLEKLIIKDTKPSLDLLNTVPSIKEFQTDIEKLDENIQCRLVEKLANGQIAVQTTEDAPECTCVIAYLDAAAGRIPCEAENCDQSSCAAIQNNYDATTRTFKTPPTIRRKDGSNALHKPEPRVYATPFQVPYEDQEKFVKGTQQADEVQRPDDDGVNRWQSDEFYNSTLQQEQNQDDETDATVENEDRENQPDLICLNLSGYQYLDAMLSDADGEYKNNSARYFCGFRVTNADANQMEEKRIKKKSDLSYDEVKELAVTTLSDVESIESEIYAVTKDNAAFRVLIKNNIEHKVVDKE